VTVAPRVLIVEDEAGLRLTLTDRLGSIRIGVVTPRCRASRHTSKPFILGSITSRTIRS